MSERRRLVTTRSATFGHRSRPGCPSAYVAKVSEIASLTDLHFPDYSRPGILVLINDADWELEGEENYEIQAGDNILFVSTLHGG